MSLADTIQLALQKYYPTTSPCISTYMCGVCIVHIQYAMYKACNIHMQCVMYIYVQYAMYTVRNIHMQCVMYVHMHTVCNVYSL